MILFLIGKYELQKALYSKSIFVLDKFKYNLKLFAAPGVKNN